MIEPQPRKVRPEFVIAHTLMDLDEMAESMATIEPPESDTVAFEAWVQVAGLLAYRRYQLARWVRDQESTRPALRATRRTE